MVIDRLPGGDPQDPPVEPRCIREPRIRPERRDERVLEAVVGLVGPDSRHEEAIDGAPMLLQEIAERRELHDLRCNHTLNNAGAAPDVRRDEGGDGCLTVGRLRRLLSQRRTEVKVNEGELIELLRERQNNGRTGYLTFGDLVALVPTDQMDEWQAVLAKVKAADAARDADEDAD